jgi:prevent-host-death family protein
MFRLSWEQYDVLLENVKPQFKSIFVFRVGFSKARIGKANPLAVVLRRVASSKSEPTPLGHNSLVTPSTQAGLCFDFPINWLTGRLWQMKSVGLFEAKTKLSEICRGVATTGQAVVVTQRGKPMVRIVAVAGPPQRASIWDGRAAYVKKNGLLTEDFDLPERSQQTWRDPLA